MEHRAVILFDGVCNLCNSAVQFVIRHDKKDQFVFASLQSAEANNILNSLYFTDNGSSFIFIEDNKVWQRSSAALRVAKKLNGLWPLLYGFILVPPFIRNGVYNIISKNRYKWFGKKEECMIPSAKLKAKFLNQ